MTESPIFTPCQIGPVTLRNRTIRASAFENMCVNNEPAKELLIITLRLQKAESND